MNINIDIYQMTNGAGRCEAVNVKADISCSPREGFDFGTIAELERDLGPYIEERLTVAIQKGKVKQ